MFVNKKVGIHNFDMGNDSLSPVAPVAPVAITPSKLGTGSQVGGPHRG